MGTIATLLGSRSLWILAAGLLSLTGCTTGGFGRVVEAIVGEPGVVAPDGLSMNQWRARTDARLTAIEQSIITPAEQIGAIASSAAVGAAGVFARRRQEKATPTPAPTVAITPPPETQR